MNTPNKNTITVTYDPSGAKGDVPPPRSGLKPGDNYSVESVGNLILSPSHQFIGWSLDLNQSTVYKPGTQPGEGSEDNLGGVIIIGEKSITLYAKWEWQEDSRKLAGRWKLTKKNDVASGEAKYFVFNGFEYGEGPGRNTSPITKYEAESGVLYNKGRDERFLTYVFGRDTVRDVDLLTITRLENDGADVVNYLCERDIWWATSTEGLMYTFVPGKTKEDGITITAYNGPVSVPVIIPKVILGLDVTAIGGRAFYQTPLTVLSFEPNSIVKSIGDDAFASCGLSSITLPNSIETIGARAFQANRLAVINTPTGLKDRVIYPDDTDLPPPGVLGIPLLRVGELEADPDTVYTRFYPAIGVSAFADSTLPSNTAILNFSDAAGPFSIGESAFARTRLTGTLIIPVSVEDFVVNESSPFPGRVFPGIGANAFNAYKANSELRNSLGSVTFTDGSHIKTIGNGAFRANQISAVTFPPSLEKIGEINPYSTTTPDGVFEENKISVLTLVGAGGIKEIGPKAFKGNKIVELTLGYGVERIGDEAFSTNTIANFLKIPGSLKYIGKKAFWDNKLIFYNRLTEDGFLSSAVNLEIGADAFARAFTTNNQSVPPNPLIISPGVIKLGEGAFKGNSSLSVIDLSGATGITEIGKSVFSGAAALEEIVIPHGVESIGDSAFRGCTKLKTVDIPASVTKIGTEAFYSTALRTITIRSPTVILPALEEAKVFGDKGSLFYEFYRTKNFVAGVYEYKAKPTTPVTYEWIRSDLP